MSDEFTYDPNTKHTFQGIPLTAEEIANGELRKALNRSVFIRTGVINRNVRPFAQADVPSALLLEKISGNQPPTTPAAQVAGVSAAGVALEWLPAYDAVGVAFYEVYRDGQLLVTLDKDVLSYIDLAVAPVALYVYTVCAVDHAGHRSPAFAHLPVITPDWDPPVTPSGLTTSQVTADVVSLFWGAAVDNVGVTAYHIYRNGIMIAGQPDGMLTYDDTDIAPETTYTYTIEAVDAAGNVSDASNACVVTTPTAAPQHTLLVSDTFNRTGGLSGSAADTGQVWTSPASWFGGTAFTLANGQLTGNGQVWGGNGYIPVGKHDYLEASVDVTILPGFGSLYFNPLQPNAWGNMLLGMFSVSSITIGIVGRNKVFNYPALVEGHTYKFKMSVSRITGQVEAYIDNVAITDGSAVATPTELVTLAGATNVFFSQSSASQYSNGGCILDNFVVSVDDAPVPQPTYLVKDLFNRADGPLAAAEIGGNWTGTGWRIVGNRAFAPAGGTSQDSYTDIARLPLPNGVDARVSVDLDTTVARPQGYMSGIFVGTPGNGYFWAACSPNTASTLGFVLGSFSGGSFNYSPATMIQNVAPETPQHLSVEITSAEIRFYYGNTLASALTLPRSALPSQDLSVGIADKYNLLGDYGQVAFDNFKVEALPPLVTDTFNRNNGTLIGSSAETGQTWAPLWPGTTGFNLFSTRVVAGPSEVHAPGGVWAAAVVPLGSSGKYKVEADVDTSSGAGVGGVFLGNMVPASTTGVWLVWDGSVATGGGDKFSLYCADWGSNQGSGNIGLITTAATVDGAPVARSTTYHLSLTVDPANGHVDAYVGHTSIFSGTISGLAGISAAGIMTLDGWMRAVALDNFTVKAG